MSKGIIIAGFAAATLASYSAPAFAWKWVTYTTAAECKPYKEPCELWVSAKFNPAKDKDLKTFQRAQAREFVRARQLCVSKGGKWLVLGPNAACAPGGPKRG